MASRVRRASVGTARKALAALTATSPPRPVWPRMTPSPPPRARAVATTAADSSSWFQNSWRMPSEPVQLADVVNQSKTCDRKCMSVRSLRRFAVAGPRHSETLGADEEEVEGGGQGDRQDQS